MREKTRANKSEGGLIVYVNESISYSRRFDLENTIESIWIQINFTNPKPFLINFIYIPPDSRQDWIYIYIYIYMKTSLDLLSINFQSYSYSETFTVDL